MHTFQQVPATQAEYTFYEDGGHGWLAVPAAEVAALGIEITTCSYLAKDKQTAYLEEDCDLAAFLDARAALGQPVRYHTIHLQQDAFIRNLPRYNIPCKQRALAL